MSLQSTPYIAFPGNAAEAFAYYHDLFGGQLDLMTYDSMPPMEGFPVPPPPGAVAHATLDAPGITLAGGDNMGDDMPRLTSDVYSFLLAFDATEEARGFISTVSDAGGEIAMPFEMAPWGDHYGQVRDRFGIRWDVVVDGSAG